MSFLTKRDAQRSCHIAHPTGIEAHVDDGLLHFRQAPSVAIVEQKTSLGTQGVLAQVALGSSGCFPAFDNLVTLTVRASDCDERHGPFLPNGGYEDEAQCDSNLSPSPLLKHYPARHALLGHASSPPGCSWAFSSFTMATLPRYASTAYARYAGSGSQPVPP